MSRVRRVDSHLGDENWKGKIVLRYPSKDVFHTKTIPFFENPEITESQSPRYANYAVVARSSNLFGYLGADSRKFNLSFNITLPNILAVGGKFDKVFNTPPTKMQKQMEIMETDEFREDVTSQVGPLMGDAVVDQAIAQQKYALKRTEGVAQKMEESYYKILEEEEKKLVKFLSYSSPLYLLQSTAGAAQRVALNAVGSFVAAIRSTVINNAVDTQYGPPLVRLSFGMLYNDVPCICKGYNISMDTKAGYDKQTLMPRVVKVNMKLEEARNLSQSSGKGSFKTSYDKLVGWEVLLGTNRIPGASMDPGNYKFWSDFGETGE